MDTINTETIDQAPAPITTEAATPVANTNTTETKTPDTQALTMDDIKLMLQKEGDRRVGPVANELKKTKDALEALQKSSMTEAQRQKYEADQERERLLNEKTESEQRLSHYMTQAELNKRGWNSDLTKFVMASTEEDVAANADALQKLIDVEVQKKLQAHLGSVGIKPTAMKSSTTAVTNIDTNDPAAVYAAVKAGKLSMFSNQ